MQFDELRHDTAQRYAAVTECGKQIILTLNVELLRNLAEPPTRRQFLRCVAEPLCLVTDEIHSALDILLAVLLLEPRTNLAARRGGGNRIQPVGTGAVPRLVRYN